MTLKHDSSASRRKLFAMLAGAVLIFVMLLWLWTRTNGVGEYRQSPDGLWTAHVSSLSRGTLWGGRNYYLEILVVASPSQTTLIRREIPHTAADRVPNYGDRSQTFITWATNSNQFTVAITNGASVAIAVSTKT